MTKSGKKSSVANWYSLPSSAPNLVAIVSAALYQSVANIRSIPGFWSLTVHEQAPVTKSTQSSRLSRFTPLPTHGGKARPRPKTMNIIGLSANSSFFRSSSIDNNDSTSHFSFSSDRSTLTKPTSIFGRTGFSSSSPSRGGAKKPCGGGMYSSILPLAMSATNSWISFSASAFALSSDPVTSTITPAWPSDNCLTIACRAGESIIVLKTVSSNSP